MISLFNYLKKNIIVNKENKLNSDLVTTTETLNILSDVQRILSIKVFTALIEIY